MALDRAYLFSIGTRSFILLPGIQPLLPLLVPFPLTPYSSKRGSNGGLGTDSGSCLSPGLDAMSAWRISAGSESVGAVISSCWWRVKSSHTTRMKGLTSNDCAYQFFTLRIDGIMLRLWGSSSSSLTLWASRTGSSSARRNPLWRVVDEFTKEPTCEELACLQERALVWIPSELYHLLKRNWYGIRTMRISTRWKGCSAHHQSGETRRSGESCPITQGLCEILRTSLEEDESRNAAGTKHHGSKFWVSN